MALKTIIYASAAKRSFREEVLYDILEAARRNNKRDGLTGVLLYGDWNFLQVLEGDETIVDHTFARIQRDPRHQSVMVFYSGMIEARGFPDWEMGFERAESDRDDALFTLSRQALEDRLTPDVGDEVQTFLRTFYDTLAPYTSPRHDRARRSAPAVGLTKTA